MKKKVALIIGITGQDGSYLSELLLKKNYLVHGIKRRSSSINTSRLDHLYVDPHLKTNFFLHYGDVTDSSNIIQLVNKIRPDEIYNLSAQSHVQTSFEMPNYTAAVNALGTLNVLEASRNSKFIKSIVLITSDKCYENIGHYKKVYSESDRLGGLDPYSASKASAELIIKSYRDSFFQDNII